MSKVTFFYGFYYGIHQHFSPPFGRNLFALFVQPPNSRKNQSFLATDPENLIYLQVVPGRAGGGSFKRKKNHIAEKDFAYRMCAR